jgi:polar amino acid transport system permease protein
MYEWDFSVILRYKWAFIQGAWVTLQITFFAVILGTLFGGLLGLGRSSKQRWINIPVSIYVELFLAIPILVLLIWIYYCGPILLNINLSGFWTAVLALSLTLSAFVAEIVRSGILAVPNGHIEAARALGMTKTQTLRYITIPQAIRVMIPPLLTMYISTLKMSSLASVVAVYELLHSAQNLIMSSFRPLEIYTVVALIYIVLILPFSLLTRRFEAKQKWRLS